MDTTIRAASLSADFDTSSFVVRNRVNERAAELREKGFQVEVTERPETVHSGSARGLSGHSTGSSSDRIIVEMHIRVDE
jgi:hypothetical protein